METNNNQKDMELWHSAKKRAGFKWSLLTYVFIHVLFTVIWFFGESNYFWPIWSMLGWGIGLVFQYFKAYQSTGLFSIEKEYNKLKEQGK